MGGDDDNEEGVDDMQQDSVPDQASLNQTQQDSVADQTAAFAVKEKAVEMPPSLDATATGTSGTSIATAGSGANGLDPEVARRIAENRAKALERKAALAASKSTEKRSAVEAGA